MLNNQYLKTSFDEVFKVNDIGKVSTTPIGEVLNKASKENIPVAGTDESSRLLLVIDQQNSFLEGGELGVPGSIADATILGKFLYSNLHTITQVALTKDVHNPIQIFHPCWWVDKEGNNPTPIETVITLEDVESGKWTPTFLKQESIEYLQQLKNTGKRELRIWTYHCLEGTYGVEFESQFMNLVYFHSLARKKSLIVLEKGKDPVSEMYGAFYREDGVLDEKNEYFLNDMLQYKEIYIAGQALSHCVLDTLTHILEHHATNKDFTRRIHLLIDCSSCIPGTEEITKIAIQEMIEKYDIKVIKADGLQL